MYFDFEDYRPDITPVGSVISWREGVLISIIVHMAMIIVLLVAPDWLPTNRVVVPAEAAAPKEDRDEPTRFVFVAPRQDVPAPKPPPRADASDMDRAARAPRRAENPTNPMPLSRGNSPERVERMEEQLAQGRGQQPDPSAGEEPKAPEPERDIRTPESQSAMASPLPPPRPRSGASARTPAGGSLGDALRNLERYVQNEQFDNPRGGADAFGPAIQFDTKGVEFGPWVRRFIAQVKRNWMVPLAAMSLRGHVVLTFNVHKSGIISDLAVVQPSSIDAFNNAAYGALASSNPTQPLPPEYPAEQAFFTVTFYYNEPPP